MRYRRALLLALLAIVIAGLLMVPANAESDGNETSVFDVGSGDGVESLFGSESDGNETSVFDVDPDGNAVSVFDDVDAGIGGV